MAEELKVISVYGTGKDRKVVLWERDDAHPDGEVFIANNGKTVEAAETPTVRRLIGEGRLKEGTAPEGYVPSVTRRVKKGSETTKTANRTGDNSVPPLRPATEAEEDAAGLTGNVEKQTAVVPERGKGR